MSGGGSRFSGDDNFDTKQATQAEMEAGIETASRAMSPIGVKQAIEALTVHPATPKGNAIVDGRFDHWFEGTSQTSNGYGSDTMWHNYHAGSTKVHTRQTLLPTDIPDVPSAEFFSRTVVTSVAGAGNQVLKSCNIENVRRYAGKVVTLSLYIRSDTVKDIAIELAQVFGSGGSEFVATPSQKITLSTSFQRFDIQISVPSVAGKTIATGSSLQLNLWLDAGSSFNSRTDSLGQQSGTFDIACIQLEEGSVATDFVEEDTGVSLARVQRHYYSLLDDGTSNTMPINLITSSSSNRYVWVAHPVTMRGSPSVVATGTHNPFAVRNRPNGSRLQISGVSVTTTSYVHTYKADARL